jgi:hypothetical protein
MIAPFAGSFQLPSSVPRLQSIPNNRIGTVAALGAMSFSHDSEIMPDEIRAERAGEAA